MFFIWDINFLFIIRYNGIFGSYSVPIISSIYAIGNSLEAFLIFWVKYYW